MELCIPRCTASVTTAILDGFLHSLSIVLQQEPKQIIHLSHKHIKGEKFIT